MQRSTKQSHKCLPAYLHGFDKSQTLAVRQVQYLSCSWDVDVRCSAMFHCDLTMTLPDRLWAVMLHRISKWRFITSKAFLIEFVETKFRRSHWLLYIFSCLFSFSSAVVIQIGGRSLEEGTGKKSVYRCYIITVYSRRSSAANWFTVACKCNAKHCW